MTKITVINKRRRDIDGIKRNHEDGTTNACTVIWGIALSLRTYMVVPMFPIMLKVDAQIIFWIAGIIYIVLALISEKRQIRIIKY